MSMKRVFKIEKKTYNVVLTRLPINRHRSSGVSSEHPWRVRMGVFLLKREYRKSFVESNTRSCTVCNNTHRTL